jgi:hypothetical protein
MPIDNLILPNLVSCDVLESNNTSEQKRLLHVLELQSSSLEIFYVNPNAMFETIVIDVDDECDLLPQKPKKVVVDVNHKFLKIWTMKMVCAKPIFNELGWVYVVKCHVCTKIEKEGKKIGC